MPRTPMTDCCYDDLDSFNVTSFEGKWIST
jgi:hypothetical protein